MTNEEHILLTSRLSRMRLNKTDTPAEALDAYFSCFTLEDCRLYLWDMYEGWVMNFAREEAAHGMAAVMIFFYTHTEMLLEAAWLINNSNLPPAKAAEMEEMRR